MASLRRSKTMPADGQTAKFLYTIIKQLDLKSIDWALVASQLDITNGHAARMRFSRLKQHMEGTSTVPRIARPKKPKQEKGDKAELKKRNLEDMRSGQDDADMEFGPKVKREVLERASENSTPPRSTSDHDGSFSQTSLLPTSMTVGEPSDNPDPLPVQASIEASDACIKLEPDDTDSVEVKIEPKVEE